MGLTTDAARGLRLSNGRYMIAVKVSDIHCQPNKCLFMKTQILAHVSLKMIALMCGFSFFANVSFAQKKKFWKHLNVEINYGLNVNFFVKVSFFPLFSVRPIATCPVIVWCVGPNLLLLFLWLHQYIFYQTSVSSCFEHMPW